MQCTRWGWGCRCLCRCPKVWVVGCQSDNRGNKSWLEPSPHHDLSDGTRSNGRVEFQYFGWQAVHLSTLIHPPSWSTRRSRVSRQAEGRRATADIRHDGPPQPQGAGPASESETSGSFGEAQRLCPPSAGLQLEAGAIAYIEGEGGVQEQG